MTNFNLNRSDSELNRENRTTVRLPDQNASRLFQGWGPKF
jgi:hypothetical protein